MSQQNPTIIVGHLDDSELTKSIDKLVAEVAKKTSGMAEDFTQAIDKMKFAMKDFAITQKVSVDLMKEAWRDMSKSFDAMVAAQSAATGGGKGGGKGKVYAPDTVGALEQEIALEKEKRREMQLGSDELRAQNRLLEQRGYTLKQQTTSLETNLAKAFQTRIGNVISLPSKSFADANEKLRRLRELLDDMQKRPFLFDESKINRVKNAIDSVETKIERMRKKFGSQGTQPSTLQQVLGMDENSFDAISKKMAALKKLSWSNPQEQKQITDEYQRLRQEQNKLMASNAQMARSNNYLAQSFGYIRNRIVYALTLGAITNFVKQLYEIRGQYELLERSLGVLVGSFEKGTQIFNELNEMAIKSPFTLIELGTAAKQLTAYNFAANEVVDTTRRLADISAALGVPMERLTYNLGQIKAQGVLNARDARDFANAGLAIVPMLAKMYTEQKTFGDEMVTTAQVYDMMSKKMVTYSDVLKVLYKVTDEGGKFFDFQAKQADTLRVQMANLTLAYNNMLNEIGSENQGVLSGMVGGLKTLLKHWRDIQRILLTLITTFGVYKTVSMLAVGAQTISAWISLAKSIKSAKDAMALFNLTTSANPLGLLASLLAAVIGYFVLFKNEVAEVSQEVEMFGESASKTISKVNTLKKVIDGTDDTSNTYKKTLSELSNIAKEYGVELDAEKARRDEINNATERTIQLIKEESAERQRANQLTKAQENYDAQANSARQSLRDSLKTAMTGTNLGIFTTKSDNKEIQQNADAIADIIGGVVESNIMLIAGKTGDEYEKGLDKMFSIIQTRMKAIGISESTISKQWLSSTLFSNTNLVNEYINNIVRAKNEQDNYVEKIEKNYKAAKKATEATMTFTQKVDANARALRNNTDDAVSLYNRVYDIVKIAKENHIINFDLKLSAEKPPKWMLDKSLPELQQLAEKFTAIAQSGGHAKGYDRESTYERGLMYASAARIKQEEEERNARNKDHETKTKQSDEIAKAIKDEISLVKQLQSAYDTLTKKGDSHANAIAKVRDLYGKTIDLLNKDMDKFGLPKLDLSIIKGNNHNEVLAFFEKLRDVLESKGLSNLERMEAVEGVVKEFRLKADTYNLDMITKGLNNELGKLKDEYELAVAIDADPELGNAFADMMGINAESLPHTVKEYADEYSKYLNKYLKGKNSVMQLTGDELRGLTRDDINALQSQVDAGTFNQEWFDAIKKAYEDISGKRKKDLEETEKWKNGLIEKYGNLQDKLTKIYKDSIQAQVNAVKTFGTEDQKSEIVRLQTRIETTDNPAELSELNKRVAEIVKDVTDKNPIALKLVTASSNEEKANISKAYWEDFKASDVYTMTFEDMSNNSTRAIELIIDKLNSLKDHVKEDPASMKALMKSLEDAEKELNTRDPFGGIARSLRDMATASQEAETAQKALWRAEVDVEQAQQAYDNAEDGTPEERAAAQQKLANAIQKRSAAEVNLTQAESKHKKAQENLKSSLQGVTGQLGNVKSLFDTVSSLFRAGGDDETADAIDAISEGFSIMTTVIMGVVAAMVLLESSQPWLLAIAAALSVIVGLVKFLSGNDNEKIDEEIKESELAVKRLENSYKRLQAAVDEAYGTMKYAAEQAAIANKKAQLAEMRRQLNLEQSRDSKDRDDDKIASIQGQIIDLQQEIEEATKNIINDMLGITSVGDAAEQMVSSMIDAFRSGEDYMGKFSDSFEDMIDNMIMKAIVSRIIGKRLESLWNEIDSKAEERGADAQAEINRLVKERQKQQDIVNSTRYFEIAHMTAEHTIEDLDRQIEEAKKRYEKAIEPTPEDVNGIRTTVEGWKDDVKNEFEAWMAAFGISYGDRSDKQISALQQGLQGVSEETASAVEAYLNGMSQQAYLRNDLLVQIRDTIMSFDMDVQLGVFSQMLLQLQNNYIVMQSMQSMMENWTVPSGSGIRVELMS